MVGSVARGAGMHSCGDDVLCGGSASDLTRAGFRRNRKNGRELYALCVLCRRVPGARQVRTASNLDARAVHQAASLWPFVFWTWRENLLRTASSGDQGSFKIGSFRSRLLRASQQSQRGAQDLERSFEIYFRSRCKSRVLQLNRRSRVYICSSEQLAIGSSDLFLGVSRCYVLKLE